MWEGSEKCVVIGFPHPVSLEKTCNTSENSFLEEWKSIFSISFYYHNNFEVQKTSKRFDFKKVLEVVLFTTLIFDKKCSSEHYT